MNHSPLILRRINKLIGQAMRQAQLMTGNELILIRSAIKWLNIARKEYKAGSFTYYLALRFVATDIRIINGWRNA